MCVFVRLKPVRDKQRDKTGLSVTSQPEWWAEILPGVPFHSEVKKMTSHIDVILKQLVQQPWAQEALTYYDAVEFVRSCLEEEAVELSQAAVDQTVEPTPTADAGSSDRAGRTCGHDAHF
jgi:hypothetical protein